MKSSQGNIRGRLQEEMLALMINPVSPPPKPEVHMAKFVHPLNPISGYTQGIKTRDGQLEIRTEHTAADQVTVTVWYTRY